MLELLWLLLPVAALSGWWIGWRQYRKPSPQTPLALSRPDYFRGLNYLLNEESDKAIDVFVRMLEVDSETVEIHMALGNLFRRRGEVDRAIRIHQNLIARPTLDRAQRVQALMSLGRDYMQAGLFDRAEGIFKDLCSERNLARAALLQLLTIYQQEKEWERAIQVAKRLQSVADLPLAGPISHFHCELADEALLQGDVRSAQQQIKKALQTDRNSVRASMVEGRVAMQRGDYRQALSALQRVERQDANYLSEVIDSMHECYRQLGNSTGYSSYLRELSQRYDGVNLLLAFAHQIQMEEGQDASQKVLAERLETKPTLRGLEYLLSANIERLDHDTRERLAVLPRIARALMENRATYRCESCGFTGRSLHWLCPQCQEWGSIKPAQDVV